MAQSKATFVHVAPVRFLTWNTCMLDQYYGQQCPDSREFHGDTTLYVTEKCLGRGEYIMSREELSKWPPLTVKKGFSLVIVGSILTDRPVRGYWAQTDPLGDTDAEASPAAN